MLRRKKLLTMILAPIRQHPLRLSGGLFTAILCFFLLQYAETESWRLEVRHWPVFILCALFGLFASVWLSYLNRKIDRWLNWQNVFAARFIIGFLVGLGSTALFAYLLWWMSSFSLPALFFLADNDQDVLNKSGILLAMVLFFHQMAYAIRFAYSQYAVEQLAAVQRKSAATAWRYKTLRAQLSPHYLFNNLNTITALIQRDADQAEAFIRQLARTYQYLLQQRHHDKVKLADELAFLKAYFYQLQIRFGEQIRLHIDVPEAILTAELPPLSLQLLVENAVKHNPPGQEHFLDIRISVTKNGQLEISNNRLPGAINDSFHIGLQHLKAQYVRLGKNEPVILAGDPFVVRLPLFDPSTESA